MVKVGDIYPPAPTNPLSAQVHGLPMCTGRLQACGSIARQGAEVAMGVAKEAGLMVGITGGPNLGVRCLLLPTGGSHGWKQRDLESCSELHFRVSLE